MPFRTLFALGCCLYVAAGIWAPTYAQRAGSFMGSTDDPAIRYATAPLNNAVVDVNRKLRDGTVRLAFEGRSGFLRSALEALQIPVDSQMLVYSPTSLQRKRISDQNPRALFFNDRVALGWVRGGGFIEVAAHDESAGIVFYTLEQRPDDTAGPPQFTRVVECLGCHLAGDTLGVPGLLMFSTTRSDQPEKSGHPNYVDHGSPLSQRFGGWFVTGGAGSARHMGNDVPALDGRVNRALTSVEGLFDAEGYRALSSDIVAQLVFAHQARMTNLLTRIGWEARAADPLQHPPFRAEPGEDARISAMLSGVANEVVDYMLFVDEARLTGAVRGTSGFSERFSTAGPRDRKGRSLHELDLKLRLMKYRCSYLIYSPAFEALPPSAKDAIYKRLWHVLSGQERNARHESALSIADRRAVVEILRDTKKDLPSYFQNAIR